MPSPRSAKVAERIHEIVASLVTNRLKDPRLELVTVTAVRITGDLQHATVFYTAYGSSNQLRDAGRALESAKGLIRSQVGAQLGLRLTPSLEFVPDALPETARSFEDALVAARHRDERIAEAAKGAEPAGDPDPYRKPREEPGEEPEGIEEPGEVAQGREREDRTRGGRAAMDADDAPSAGAEASDGRGPSGAG